MLGTFPHWLDYALSENTAAAMFRGLGGLSARWGELIASAQVIIGIYQELTEEIEQMYEEENVLPLIAASRILDAASQEPTELSYDDRRDLGLLAAVAFAMYGNFPSATAVIQRIQKHPNFFIDSAALAAIIATVAPSLLGKMLPYCQSGSPEQIYLEKLEVFLAVGETNRIEAAREALIPCLLNAPSPFESSIFRSARLCLEHLLRLSVARTLDEYGEQLPKTYIRSLLDSGIRVLLPPQFRAITQHQLLTSSNNAIVALPTSTGKTLIGELCLIAGFRQEPGIACYLAPYVALGHQVAQRLEEHVPQNIRIRRMIGNFRETEQLEPVSSDHRAEIIVATPERLDALLRTTPDLRHNLRCVVCDEAHLVQNDVRGIRLEGILTRLRLLQTQGFPIRLILLSAVLSEYDKLSQWIGVPEESVITDSWRPTARRLAFWKQNGSLTWYVGNDPIRRSGTASESIIGKRDLPWPERDIYPAKHIGQIRQQESLTYVNVAYLSDLLVNRYGGTVLCVCATRESTRKVAAALARRFPPLEPLPQRISETIAYIEHSNKFLLPMCDFLRAGVAYHNSALPYRVRQLLEDAINNAELVAVAATTTLAEGVDLPFRFTILVDWLVWQGTEQRPISSLLFRNVAGRCGRAGVFTEGDTIVFDNPLGDLRYTHPYQRERTQNDIFLAEKPEVLKSALEILTQSPEGVLKEFLEAILASQFMAAIPENPDIDDLVNQFVNHTFLTYRLGRGDPIREVLSDIANDLLDETRGALAVAASPLRLTPLGEAANRTGFSPLSCRHIIAFLQENYNVEDAPSLSSYLLQKLGTLPEQTHQDLRKVLLKKNSRFSVKPNDFSTVLNSWYGGIPLEYIFAALPYVVRSKRRPRIQAWLDGSREAEGWNTEFDKFVDFTTGVLGGYLPWLMRACGRFSEHIGGWSQEVEWTQWADSLESRINPESGDYMTHP